MKTDADIWREAVELLKAGTACPQKDCGWSCCALSKAIGHGQDQRWRDLHHAFVLRFGGAWWWGKPRSDEATAARVAAMQTMAEEAETVHA